MSWWDDIVDWVRKAAANAVAAILNAIAKIGKVVSGLINQANIFLAMIRSLAFKAISDIAKAVTDGTNWLKSFTNQSIRFISDRVKIGNTLINKHIKRGVIALNSITNQAFIDINNYISRETSKIGEEFAKMYHAVTTAIARAEKLHKAVLELFRDPAGFADLVIEGLEIKWEEIDTGEIEEGAV